MDARMHVEYIAVGMAMVVLGCYVFMLYRWWYKQLTRLAERFDVVDRRQHATRRFPLVMLCVLLPMGGTLIGCIRLTKVDSLFILIAFVACVAPGIIWWTQRMKKLTELGYRRK